MAKHVGKAKMTIGAIFALILGYVIGQIAPPFIVKQIETMTSKPLTSFNESVYEFSAFYTKELYWPYSPCSAGPVTTLQDLSPEEAFPREEEYMMDAIASERVLPWDKAQLTLLLSVNNPNEAIAITEISAEVYKYEPVQPKWLVYPEEGGCGGAYQRNFNLRLANGVGTVIDQGIVEGVGEKPAKIKDISLESHAWTVSQNDLSELTINVMPEDGYYEFGVKIHYLLNGNEEVRTMGSKDQPYKVIGGKVGPSEEFVLVNDVGLQEYVK